MDKKFRITIFLFLCSLILLPARKVQAEEALTLGVSPFESGNRIWFYDMAGGAYSSDCILIETNGHWGLIDSGNRYDDTIKDADGTLYSVKQSFHLSCQTEGKNGKDAISWMVENLGVDHLDFIIGTHAHSDHIGGVPEITGLTFLDHEGNEKHLVDENTVYIYKDYHHVNAINDDLGEPKVQNSWHNQAFVYQAVSAVEEQGGTVAEISRGQITNSESQPSLDYEDVAARLLAAGLTEFNYVQGDENNWFDDRICFQFGDFSFSLYNLFSVSDLLDENVNSIACVISDGNHLLYTAGDLNVEQETEQKVARAIASDFGQKIDAVKMSHHGNNRSNSKELLDLFQPSVTFCTSALEDATMRTSQNGYVPAVYYARTHFGTEIYEVAAADRALILDFSDEDLKVLQAIGDKESFELSDASSCENQRVISDYRISWEQNVEGSEITSLVYFFKDQIPQTGWVFYNGKWYYCDEEGFMQRGWLTLEKGTYYLSETNTSDHLDGELYTGYQIIGEVGYLFAPDGRLICECKDTPSGWYQMGDEAFYVDENQEFVTGWQQINGHEYFFNQNAILEKGWHKEAEEPLTRWYYLDTGNGEAAVGWKKIDENWYYFDENRVMQTGWLSKEQNQYYLDDSGCAAIGWKMLDEKWHYFNEDRVMQTGWLFENENRYYLDANGCAAVGWTIIDEKQYYFNPSAKMRTGWLKDEGNWYYFNSDGTMTIGWTEIGDAWYYMNPSGIMQTGWLQEEENWYYLTDSGRAAVGWRKINEKWYYFNPSTKMRTGWLQDNGHWYYLTSGGSMAIGWVKVEDSWYYMNLSGIMQTGWQTIEGSQYFFKSSGAMAAEEWADDGWWLSASGVWTYPYKGSWKHDKKGWKYVDTSGWYAKNTTVKINNVEYTFNAKGYLLPQEP